MLYRPPENRIQDIIREGNIIGPKSELQEEFSSGEKKMMLMSLLGIWVCAALGQIHYMFMFLMLIGCVMWIIGLLFEPQKNFWTGMTFAFVAVLTVAWGAMSIVTFVFAGGNEPELFDAFVNNPVVVLSRALMSLMCLVTLLFFHQSARISLGNTRLYLENKYVIAVGIVLLAISVSQFFPDSEITVILRIALAVISGLLLRRLYKELE